MFNSTILDVAVGLLFTFLAVSLVASTVTEALASAAGWRANTLLAGVKSLVNDPNFSSLAKDLYNHGLVNPGGNGTAANENALATKPSYIDPQHFAAALIDVLKKSPNAQNQVAAGIQQLSDPQLKQTLQGLWDRSHTDTAAFQNAVAHWFDISMDRVSGVYKRRTQIWAFGIGLAVTVILNVDTLHIAQSLWLQPMLVQKLGTQSSLGMNAAVSALTNQDLPIGWSAAVLKDRLSSNLGIATAVLGWIITAFATLFGAPFWFDALQSFARIRGTGAKPD